MIKFEDIKDIFQGFSITLHDEQSFVDEDDTIPLPYMYYYATQSHNLEADGSIYLPIVSACVRLITETSDFHENRKVEEVLRKNGIVYSMKVESLQDEAIFVTDYRFDARL